MSVAVVDAMGARLVGRAFGFAIVVKAVLMEFGLLQWGIASIAPLIEVASLQVEGVTSVKITVNWVAYVGSVNGGGEIIVEPETVNTFAQSIEVIILR